MRPREVCFGWIGSDGPPLAQRCFGHHPELVEIEDAGKNKHLNDRLHSLPIWWMAVVFFGCAYLSAAAVYAVVVEFQTSVWVRAKEFSASMLSPMGTLFALFVVFTAAQVWSDNDHANAAVDREASALREVLILATAFPAESRSQVEALVYHHIEEAATKVWPMMAHRSVALENAPHNLVEALHVTLGLTPSSLGQGIAQREMALALESALDARRQRVLVSHSEVGFVKWACLVIKLSAF
jgi:Protein of unknown function (DUF4239)